MTEEDIHFILGRMRIARLIARIFLGVAVTLGLLCPVALAQIHLNPNEREILIRLNHLRALSQIDRVAETHALAQEIRQLPDGRVKVSLATGLASESTEGDFGHGTVQAVADTLSESLQQSPIPPTPKGLPAMPYLELATLARYEHVNVTLTSSQYNAALAQLVKDDQQRAGADFTLKDLNGQSWNLKSLRGKVVMVNFWATWCPPCRSEMPDLQGLYKKFHSKGVIILGISDEKAEKVAPFVKRGKISYPILLDPGDIVSKQFRIDGIPHTFIYDRAGHLAAEAMDMRTRKQFLALLAQAGMK